MRGLGHFVANVPLRWIVEDSAVFRTPLFAHPDNCQDQQDNKAAFGASEALAARNATGLKVNVHSYHTGVFYFTCCVSL